MPLPPLSLLLSPPSLLNASSPSPTIMNMFAKKPVSNAVAVAAAAVTPPPSTLADSKTVPAAAAAAARGQKKRRNPFSSSNEDGKDGNAEEEHHHLVGALPEPKRRMAPPPQSKPPISTAATEAAPKQPLQGGFKPKPKSKPRPPKKPTKTKAKAKAKAKPKVKVNPKRQTTTRDDSDDDDSSEDTTNYSTDDSSGDDNDDESRTFLEHVQHYRQKFTAQHEVAAGLEREIIDIDAQISQLCTNAVNMRTVLRLRLHKKKCEEKLVEARSRRKEEAFIQRVTPLLAAYQQANASAVEQQQQQQQQPPPPQVVVEAASGGGGVVVVKKEKIKGNPSPLSPSPACYGGGHHTTSSGDDDLKKEQYNPTTTTSIDDSISWRGAKSSEEVCCSTDGSSDEDDDTTNTKEESKNKNNDYYDDDGEYEEEDEDEEWCHEEDAVLFARGMVAQEKMRATAQAAAASFGEMEPSSLGPAAAVTPPSSSTRGQRRRRGDQASSSVRDETHACLTAMFQRMFLPNTVKPQFVQRDVCRCGSDLLKNISQSQLVCPKCGICTSYIESTCDALAYGQDYEIPEHVYERVKHFRTWLGQYRKGAELVPDHVIRRVYDEFRKTHDNSTQKVRPTPVRKMLRRLGLQAYCPVHERITARLNHERVAEFNDVEFERLLLRFRMIQVPFQHLKEPDRKNFMNFNYVVHKFVQMEGWDHFKRCFPLLKTKGVLVHLDVILKRICEMLQETRIHANQPQWVFYRSV